MISRRAVGLPEKSHGQASDIRPVKMKLSHLEDGRCSLHAQNSRDKPWKIFRDYSGFLKWVSIYRGMIVERTDDHTIFEMPVIVSVFNVPKKFFNAIAEPKDIVWTMRRVHPDYIAGMDRFAVTHGLTTVMGQSVICKRLFLYRKHQSLPYCVILIVHDYIEFRSKIKYV